MTVAIGFNLMCFVMTVVIVFTIGWDMGLKEKIIFIISEVVLLAILTLGVGMMTNWQ